MTAADRRRVMKVAQEERRNAEQIAAVCALMEAEARALAAHAAHLYDVAKNTQPRRNVNP